MKIKIHARTSNALNGLESHYKKTKNLKNKIKLGAYGISHKLDKEKNLLIIDFGGLINKISKKGDSYNGYKESTKNNLLANIDDVMTKNNASKKDYEVVFVEQQ